MKLDLSVEHKDNGAVEVKLDGDITIQTSPQLKKALSKLFKGQDKTIRLDLTDVKFMDTSGLATLVEGLQWSRSGGGDFKLTGLSENVRDVFELAKLDGEFDIVGHE
ncbi:MAG: anti-anti-sigma factor [Zetaproteobacteria bacterium CG_4_9_14_3_um_filter_49_83]|nr:MAG: anti-anti-sigma factor [Zetaproteobacteria bacterium CG1_02_49_23]PIQ32113.1 MAG: anti-anti-sigma factor [Zetaproteobacteria bacterium CG17_big_fil_post_rev_8_21_14_2_50_50_13]PIV30086.1 MAG: anti-anti-sigma factor [Zetaproteobacteria bacterium CG02_land_8_20_14_3_00_50_9]PIY54761.1 MAG: anti-anti-sigma factor [Zetaproteobacteria bacterium CG_4_10_14_0_8_um_filter_49_80]PJA34323.1 MAG: anti-anti-sigma factor [Zetaproteobacteria bacterium CG_4_9_14_3_um_filter_49_83]